MFGYIKIYKPEMKMKDYDAYKGIYCSLCRRLGHDYGILARFTLNYDFALLALTRLAFAKECCGFQKGHCSFNPAKKCLKCVGGADELGFTAAAAIIMCYYKTVDNIADSRSFKKIGALLLKPYFAFKRRKAIKKYNQLDEIISRAMLEQSKAEKSKDAGVDASAHPSAHAMGELLSYGFEGETAQKLERFGYLAGRWVYFMDALDDMEDDRKDGSYNVFNNKSENKKENRAYAVRVLNLTAAQLTREFKALSPLRFGEILENIVFDGMDESMKQLIAKEEEDERPL